MNCLVSMDSLNIIQMLQAQSSASTQRYRVFTLFFLIYRSIAVQPPTPHLLLPPPRSPVGLEWSWWRRLESSTAAPLRHSTSRSRPRLPIPRAPQPTSLSQTMSSEIWATLWSPFSPLLLFPRRNRPKPRRNRATKPPAARNLATHCQEISLAVQPRFGKRAPPPATAKPKRAQRENKKPLNFLKVRSEKF